ncbi:MAG TPA: YdcF family protein [Planctomycetota bacterium]|jgi:hypothetical protein
MHAKKVPANRAVESEVGHELQQESGSSLVKIDAAKFLDLLQVRGAKNKSFEPLRKKGIGHGTAEKIRKGEGYMRLRKASLFLTTLNLPVRYFLRRDPGPNASAETLYSTIIAPYSDCAPLNDNSSDGKKQKVSDLVRVEKFFPLTGNALRPQGCLVPRRFAESQHIINSFLAKNFFGPLDEFLRMLNQNPLQIKPENLRQWNTPNAALEVKLARSAARVLARSSSRKRDALRTALIKLAHNLNAFAERPPSPWRAEDISGQRVVLFCPGGRKFDRPGQAFHEYIKTAGTGWILTAGKGPYWEKQQGVPHEADAFASFLRLLEVPDSRIFKEVGSRDTLENAKCLMSKLQEIAARAAQSLSDMSLVVITHPYHVARCVLNCQLIFMDQNVTPKIYAVPCSYRYSAHSFDESRNRFKYVKVVLTEYLKIATDVCANERPCVEKIGASY